jgi:hypothetical protein
MNFYSATNLPKRGTARRIWRAFEAAGFQVAELHYNPNLWGRGGVDGWGTWACEVCSPDRVWFETWCFIQNGTLYLQGNAAPYAIYRVGEAK